MSTPSTDWPPKPGYQKWAPDKDGLLRLRTDQATKVSDEFVRSLMAQLEEVYATAPKHLTPDPLRTKIRSHRGWRTEEEYDAVQERIHGA